jgi:hypothetical protein
MWQLVPGPCQLVVLTPQLSTINQQLFDPEPVPFVVFVRLAAHRPPPAPRRKPIALASHSINRDSALNVDIDFLEKRENLATG